MDKIRLVIPGEKIKEPPKLGKLELNLNGRKSKNISKGRNTYKRALNRFRRALRW